MISKGKLVQAHYPIHDLGVGIPTMPRVYSISQTLDLVSAGLTKVVVGYRNSKNGFSFLISLSVPLRHRVKVFRHNRTEKSMRISGEITFINKKS